MTLGARIFALAINCGSLVLTFPLLRQIVCLRPWHWTSDKKVRNQIRCILQKHRVMALRGRRRVPRLSMDKNIGFQRTSPGGGQRGVARSFTGWRPDTLGARSGFFCAEGNEPTGSR